MKKQNLKPAVVIFSVDRTGRTPCEQMDWRRWARNVLKKQDINYKQVIGYYNGNREMSFVVPADAYEMVRIITRSASQDYFLYVDMDRSTSTVDVMGTHTEIGQFVHCPNKPTGDYTVDNGNYYEVI